MALADRVKARGDYINGRFVRRRQLETELVSIDPCDGESELGRFPVFPNGVEEAVTAAHRAAGEWAAIPFERRRGALHKLKAQLRNYAAALTCTLAAETGRPRWEAREEVRALTAEIDSLLRYGLAELGLRQRPPGARVEARPLGVIAVLAACPQPALLLHADVIAALATGCTVVCKASEHTPAVAQLYAELVHEADLPRGVFNLVQGGPAVGERLAADPRVAGVLFSGREETALELHGALRGEQPRPGLKTLRLLTSALPSALVLEDANLHQAAHDIVLGACLTAGQRCTSTRRVLVQRRVLAPLRERLIELLKRLTIGGPDARDAFLGPMIDAAARARYLEQLARLRASSADELVSGGALDRQGFFVRPALFELPLPEEPAAGENHGPLLTLGAADELDAAMALFSSDPRHSTISIFTRSRTSQRQARAAAPGGTLLFNAPTTLRVTDLPRQPHGILGNSPPAGSLTARVCTELQVVVTCDPAFDATMLPPGLPRLR